MNAKSAWQRKTDETTKEVDKKELDRFSEKDNLASRLTGSQCPPEEERRWRPQHGGGDAQ